MFTTHVLSFINQNKKVFVYFILVYLAIHTSITGVVSQGNYQLLTQSIQDFGPNIVGGEVKKSTEALVLFTTTIMGGLDNPLTEVQQVLTGISLVFLWLALIWLARHIFNNVKVKLRDALYNAGAPLFPGVLVALVAVIQLLPAALGVLGYVTLSTAGVIESGPVAMLTGLAAILLVTLSAYWIVSTFIALVVVTVPGTYPMQAIKMAGDIVIGRRSQVILRLLWMVLCIVAIWAIILIPVILIADLIPWEWLPLVPITIQVLNAISFIFIGIYIYILYRGMINESLVPKKA